MARPPQSLRELILRLAQDVRASRATVALTGAGISVESGIPPFRGRGGLWERFDPEQYAHISAFRRDPGRVWEMLVELLRIIGQARPNPAHLALAELERMGYLRCVITQNVDGLHQEAGSRRVIEFHGNNRTLVCLECGQRYGMQEVSLEALPPRCRCGGVLKPDVVFFGEPIPPEALEEAVREARGCDLMLAIGTSAVVYPAAGLPELAKRSGAKVVEVNPEPTPLTDRVSDYLIPASASQVLPPLVEELRG